MNNLVSLFPNYLNSDSLFQKMVLMGAPWTTAIAKSMDLSYFTMYSGIKTPTRFVSLTTTPQNQVANSQLIAQTLWDIFGKNWVRLWDDYVTQYNPIENYNLSETVERDQTDDRTIGRKGTLSSSVDSTTNQTFDSTGSSSLEHGHIIDSTDERYTQTESDGTSALEHGQVVNNQNTIDQYRYGFNSTEQVPTDVQTEGGSQTHSGTDTTTNNSTSKVSDNDTSKQTNSGTDTTNTKDDSTTDITSKDTRSDTTTDDTTDSDVLNENITRKRAGNIGVTTTQDMLLQDFELWKWNFFFQVFEDCDKFLCLSVIDDCQF